MAVTLTTDQHFVGVTLDIRFADKPDGTPGDPAPVQAGSVVWATSDATVLSVTPSADGMTADEVSSVAPSQLDAAGNPIPNRITVTADADLGAGVVTITGVSEDVFVTLAPVPQAAVLKITFPPAVPKA